MLDEFAAVGLGRSFRGILLQTIPAGDLARSAVAAGAFAAESVFLPRFFSQGAQIEFVLMPWLQWSQSSLLPLCFRKYACL